MKKILEGDLMTLEKNFNNKKILGLDFLKTVAIIAVTLFHISAEKFPGTFFGVTIFFVVTGYLVAYTAETARLAGKFDILNYFFKRVKRIYPSLLIVIFSTVGIYYFLAPKVIEVVRPEIISVLLGYNNWWQISQSADYFARLNNLTPFTHLWFLGVELQYFILFPAIFLIYAKISDAGKKNFALAFVAVLAVISAVIMPLMYQPGMDATRLYYGTDTRVHALLFGTFLGLLHADKKVTEKISSSAEKIFKQIIFFLCLAGILISAVFVSGQSEYVWQGGMIFQALVICLMLALLADESLGLGKFFEKKFFTWLGRRSYGLFLWQYPILFLFSYRGWNNLVLEILLIILLTLWSDAISNFLTSRKFPAFENYLPIVRKSFFISVTIFGMIVMGFGFKGVAVSAETKADTEELKILLENNKAIVEEQNSQVVQQPVQENLSPQEIDLNGVVFVGDSITLASANELHQLFPNCYIDAAISRHIQGGLPAIQNFDAQGKLGNIVVISLGTNGTIEEFGRYQSEMQEILNYLGADRKIFLVNIYYTPQSPYQEWLYTNHNYIKQLAADNENIFEVDWFSAISQHPEEIMSDGIHPLEGGSQIYAKVIHDRIVEELSR